MQSGLCQETSSSVLASANHRSLNRFTEISQCLVFIKNISEKCELSRLLSKCSIIAKSPRMALLLQSKNHDELFLFSFLEKNLGR